MCPFSRQVPRGPGQGRGPGDRREADRLGQDGQPGADLRRAGLHPLHAG